MTAGGGIIHREMPKPSQHMLGAQLWINLPKKDKMTAPAYNDIRAEAIAKVAEDGARIAVVSGEYKGVRASMQGDFVKTTYLDIELESGREWTLETPPENTVFLYIVLGSLRIDGVSHENRRAVLFGRGERICVTAGEKGVLRQAARRTGRLGGADRHEYARRAGAGLPRARRRHLCTRLRHGARK